MKGTILYIAGLAHSGSTFLSRVLNQHDDIFAAGELLHLHEVLVERNRGCSCTNEDYTTCPFWRPLREELRDRGVTFRTAARLTHVRNRAWLQALLAYYGGQSIGAFSDQNRKLIECLTERTGATVILDNSKTIWRLLPLRKAFGDNVKVLHLIKSPRQQLRSRTKRGYNFYHSAFLKYLRKNLLLQGLFRNQASYKRIKFEAFVRRPKSVVDSIFDWLDLGSEDVFDKPLAPFHHLRGNKQAFGDLDTLRPDPAKLRIEEEFSLPREGVLRLLRSIY